MLALNDNENLLTGVDDVRIELFDIISIKHFEALATAIKTAPRPGYLERAPILSLRTRFAGLIKRLDYSIFDVS